MCRLKRNDIATSKYILSNTITDEGINSNTLTYDKDISADWQPIASDMIVKKYGIDSAPSYCWIVYCDIGDYKLNNVAKKNGSYYICKSEKQWYAHSECLFEPYNGNE